jgi:hypothetical protein
VAAARDGTVEWEKAACDVRPFLRERHRLPVGTVSCLAHTRFATQGHEGFARNNHPIRRGTFYLVHNGIVTNENELFSLAARDPYGTVDSEALAAIVAASGSLAASLPWLERVKGSAAIAALDERDGSVLVARVSSSPVYVLETRRLVLWASTSYAVEEAHRRAVGSLRKGTRAYALEEGEALLFVNGKRTRLTFAAPAYEVYRPSWEDGKKWQGGKTTTANGATFRTGYSWEKDEDEKVPVDKVYLADECEICHLPLTDAYDLYDGDDTYEVCEVCYGTFGHEELTGRGTA